jgi:peptidoglycan/LPS O-acetylase OafA/YrhL
LLFLAIILSIASLIISGRDDVLAYLPFFVGGMLAARSQLAVSTQLASIFGLVVAIYFVGSSLITYNIFSLGGELFSHKAGLPPLNQIILALLASPVALWTVRRPSTGFDKVLADQSYIVYLVHAVAVDILTRFVPTYANDDYLSRLIIAAVTIFLVGLCCHLLWKFVDEPSNRARHRFVQARMALQ